MEATVRKTFVDSYNAPILVEDASIQHPPIEGAVSEESVRRELEQRRFIAIPSRRSLLFTADVAAKKSILMRLVYTGQISVDISIAKPDDETSETCWIFYNTKPNVGI